MNNFICSNLSKDDSGKLYFAGVSVKSMAEKYGTPLYLMDEERLRLNCRNYIKAVNAAFGENGRVIYASKANSFKRMCEIAFEEGLCLDVVSCGEICTAIKAGFPLEKAYFHSNNKTDKDIDFAIKNGIGCFVVDNSEELYAIDEIAKKYGKTQNVILRITPGIDPHTFEAVATGQVDSKFGSAIETGQALEITELCLTFKNINLLGFHCHVGSMCFDSSVFIDSADVMLNFIRDIKDKTGFEAQVLDLGGGYGVRYIEEQPTLDIVARIKEVGEFVNKKVKEIGIKLPLIAFEPGRGIVADAGLAVYTVGTVKKITGYKNYVSIDGGMSDNPRFALYGAPYTVLAADRLDEPCDMLCSLVGRCCESGDVIQEDIHMPSSTERGDLVCTCTAGAYQYSMASHYNRIPNPPVVMLNKGEDYLVIKGETNEDMCKYDI